MFKKTKKVFLDYASTTPTDPRVVRTMTPFFTKKFHNASALYDEGVDNRNALDDCREKIARLTQTKPDEIIFTGSGTESDNLAIVGVARAIVKKHADKFSDNKKPHIITTNIEHVAVLESCRQLEREGFDVTYLPVNENGLVQANQIKKELRSETILISVMLANNEIGTVMPIRQISAEVKKYKKEQGKILHDAPYFHTDASQAPNHLNINVDGLGVDMMALDGSKIYGPKGVGCLIKKSFVPAESILYGGVQEDGLRPGTENLASIVGFTRALEITMEMREKETARVTELQKYFLEQLADKIPQAKLNGSKKHRLPNIVNICIPDLNAEFAVIQLNEKGISCAAMTACKNLSGDISSYVVKSLGDGCEKSSLRFSLGRGSRKGDVDFVVEKLTEILG
jgi:cysteine desulfurase